MAPLSGQLPQVIGVCVAIGCVGFTSRAVEEQQMTSQKNQSLDAKSFNVDLQICNSQTLPQLVPSAERPSPREIIRNGIKSVTETSGVTYIFGTVTQSAKRSSVRLILRLLGPSNWSQDVEITMAKEAKSYFLLPILIPSISSLEEPSPIRAQIQKIIPIPQE